MQQLPTGTVTFLFSDIEGSTRLLTSLGVEGYAAALTEHRRVLQSAVATYGGVGGERAGDAFFAAFSTAPDALAAATEASRTLASGLVRVRIGIHTGTPAVVDGDYVGLDVHRAARIAAAGHGGQVLLSAATAALVAGEGLRDLGEHRFKDLTEPERVFQLGSEDFPPLVSLYQTNLPEPATPFLGRVDELAAIEDLLTSDGVGLLTLTGPGGTGKTRLALQAATNAAESFPEGVFWVALAPLRDATLVAGQVLAALGMQEEPDRSPEDTLTSGLQGRRLLLVLDNAEHLLPEVATTVSRLNAVEGPSLLVTSRERLQLQAERVRPVPTLEQEEGIAFFLFRARALDPGFSAVAAVGELCDRLDGLPLALELAAARTQLFTPEQLVERLGQRLDLLHAGRDSDPRQHTLRATIAWSHDLLSADEQCLFRRFAVFSGGSTLEAAESVCGADAEVLQSLLNKSLLRRRDAPTGSRYWMLETIKEYAGEELASSGELEQVERTHAVEVERFVRRLDEGRPEGWMLMLDAEHPNLRAAHDWALAQGEAALALGLATSARTFWEARGHVDEGLRRLLAALAQPGAPDTLRARGLYAAAVLRARRLQYAEAEHLFDETVALCRSLGDEQGLARALNSLGIARYRQERLVEAEAALTESLELKKRLGDDRGAAIALLSLGNAAIAAGDLALAESRHREALATLRVVGDELGVSVALDNLASLRLLADDDDGARELLEESLDVARRVGALTSTACALAHLGQALTRADRDRAHALLAEALALFQSLSEDDGVAATLEAFAGWWLEPDPERAAILLGAAGALRARVGASQEELERRASERVERSGRRTLTDVEWDTAVANGRCVGVAAAAELALRPPLQQPVEARP